jgi:hypothetical protein
VDSSDVNFLLSVAAIVLIVEGIAAIYWLITDNRKP